MKSLADRHGVVLLPEIHSTYADKIHEVISAKGFMTYDFFLPGLLKLKMLMLLQLQLTQKKKQPKMQQY